MTQSRGLPESLQRAAYSQVDETVSYQLLLQKPDRQDLFGLTSTPELMDSGYL